jgi:hypothetical protein
MWNEFHHTHAQVPPAAARPAARPAARRHPPSIRPRAPTRLLRITPPWLAGELAPCNDSE